MSKYRPIAGHWQREFARKNPPKVEPDYKTGADRGKSRAIVVPAGAPITVYSDSDSPAAIQVVQPPDGDRLLITNYPGNEDGPGDISPWLDYARDLGRTPIRVMVTPEHLAKLMATMQREARTYIAWCCDKELTIEGVLIVANDQINAGEYVIVLEPQTTALQVVPPMSVEHMNAHREAIGLPPIWMNTRTMSLDEFRREYPETVIYTEDDTGAITIGKSSDLNPPKPQGLEHAWKHPPGERQPNEPLSELREEIEQEQQERRAEIAAALRAEREAIVADILREHPCGMYYGCDSGGFAKIIKLIEARKAQ